MLETRAMNQYIERGNINGSHKREHVLIAEKALGHPLPPQAEVHHVNKVKSDNRNKNLVICEDTKYHSLLHQRMRALQATGSAHAKFCVLCKQWSTAAEVEMKVNVRNWRHPQCHADYERNRLAKTRSFIRGPYAKRGEAMTLILFLYILLTGCITVEK